MHSNSAKHQRPCAPSWIRLAGVLVFLAGILLAAGLCTAGPRGDNPVRTVFGTVLVASGAGTLNQLIERRFDAEMRRTARRPIAVGRIAPLSALIFGTLLSFSGVLSLALTVRPAASALALLTLCGYLFLYTPLKRRTPLCTLVGAVTGAIPVLIGYAAVAGKLAARAWLLYTILFLWQFPHFMAMAWMYCDDYVRAGFQVLTQGPEKSQFVGRQSAIPTLAQSVACVVITLRHTHPVLVVGAVFLSLGFLYFVAKFALIRSNGSACRLLLVSVPYLPMVARA